MFHALPLSDSATCHNIAMAGFFNLLAWLSWVRGREMGKMTCSSVDGTPLQGGPTLGLPRGVGALLFRLLKETKSNPSQIADVIIAWKCVSGLSIGKWWTHMLSFMPHPNSFLLASGKWAQWSSWYFRKTYAYPLLEAQRLTGEPTLRAFSLMEGCTIPELIYALHSWRRGS